MKQELSAPPTTVDAAVPRAPAPPKEAAKTGPPKVFGIDQRYVAPIFISCILLVGHLTAGILESPIKTLSAIATAMVVEIVLHWLHNRKFPFLASAYITGISVGILVRSPALWPYIVCSAIAITSKYAIRINGKHLWNPSNFAIAMMLFLASYTVASLSIQWSNSVYALLLIWVMGGIIIAAQAAAHHADVCNLIPRLLVFANSLYRPLIPRRGRAYHGSDVPALHLLYDYGPADDREGT